MSSGTGYRDSQQNTPPEIRVAVLASFVAYLSLTELARDVGEQVVVAGTTRFAGGAAVQVLAGFGLAFHLTKM